MMTVSDFLKASRASIQDISCKRYFFIKPALLLDASSDTLETNRHTPMVSSEATPGIPCKPAIRNET